MESAGSIVISSSPARHYAPRRLADRDRFDCFEGSDVDHGDVVADPVRRVEPTLVGVKRQAPYPLPDDQITHHLIALRIDYGNAVCGSERDEGEFAIAGDRDPDRLDRLGRHPRNSETDTLDYLAFCRVDDADRPADFGGNPKLRSIGGPYGTTRAAVDEDVGDDLALGRVDDVRHVRGFGGVDEVFAVRANAHTLRFDANRNLGDDVTAVDIHDRD